MAQKTFNLGLTIVALVALVSIVSLVALVLFSAKSPRFATGGQIVSAQETANAAGQAGTRTTVPLCPHAPICVGNTYYSCNSKNQNIVSACPGSVNPSTGSGSTPTTGGTGLSGDCAKYNGVCSTTPISGKIGYPGLCGSVSILCYR